MGLRSVLVDRAHTVTRGPVGPKVGGQTPMGDIDGPTFRCRISSPQPDELSRDNVRFTEYVRDLTMLTDTEDLNGNAIEIDADDRVVIESGPYEGEYSIMGQPTPVRKKRRDSVIAWNVALKEQLGKKDS